MKRIILILLLILPIAIFAQKTVVKVSNPVELQAAIKSNTKIVLTERFYNAEKTAITIDNVNNLEIVGEGDIPAKVTSKEGSYDVLIITNSYNITLTNLMLGHSPPVQFDCSSPVISIEKGKDIIIKDCELYGSGSLGIFGDDVKNLTCENVIVRSCVAGAFNFIKGQNIKFKKGRVFDNKIQILVSVDNCIGVEFDGTWFYDNYGYDKYNMFFASNSSMQFSVKNCIIESNSCTTFIKGDVDLSNNEIDNNDFKTLKKD